MKKRLLIIVLSLIFSMSYILSVPAHASIVESYHGVQYAFDNAGDDKAVDKQLNSMAMLNYMTVLSQEINASANSKLYLDNKYDEIINNLQPDSIDKDTLTQIKVLLNTIEAYQSIDTKRERVQYIYEQNQAGAIKKIIPKQGSILNIMQSDNNVKAIISAIFMTVDSVNNYKSYVTEVDNKYLEDNWKLDDEAINNLNECRKDAFSYMVEICREHKLDGKLALNEDAVKEFVTWENQSNIKRKIDFFENNENKYQGYGKYWLVLADSYYKSNDYVKCLEAIDEYESMNINFFKYDSDYARTLSIGIYAASEVYKDEEEYVKKATDYCNKICANVDNKDWTLKYFVAQTYADLYFKTGETSYLDEAYKLAKSNVNYLVDEQLNNNNLYMADVVKEVSKKSDTKDRKNEVKQYNKWIEEQRKVELPPVYLPLVTNCELLFALAKEKKIDFKEQSNINDILHPNGERLFYNTFLDNKFYYNKYKPVEKPEIIFDGDTFKIPVEFLTIGTKLNVTVNNNGQRNVSNDWTLEKVTREDKNDISTFYAVFSSKSIKKVKYENGDTIELKFLTADEGLYDGPSYMFNAIINKKLKFLNDKKFEMVK